MKNKKIIIEIIMIITIIKIILSLLIIINNKKNFLISTTRLNFCTCLSAADSVNSRQLVEYAS